MSDYKINQINDYKTADSSWKALFIAGGAVPLVTLAFYLIQAVIMIFGVNLLIK